MHKDKAPGGITIIVAALSSGTTFAICFIISTSAAFVLQAALLISTHLISEERLTKRSS